MTVTIQQGFKSSGYTPGGTDVALADGGTGASLTDPNADRILFWDDSAGAVTWLTAGTGLTITDTTMTASGSALTLLQTLTTTSGSTHQVTGIDSSYREIWCEVNGVSFSGSVTMQLALSSTNGAAYGTAFNIAPVTGAAANTLNGVIRIANIRSTVATGKAVHSLIRATSGVVVETIPSQPDTNTAAACDAIQFSGGTFDAGSISVYGLK